MSDFYNEAKKKLDEGVKARLDKYGEVMKQAVHDALLNFIAQDEEFAQAVAQGGSFADAMNAVAKEIKGQSISDMEAYGAAVRFFFPGAEIRVSMTIDLIGEGAGQIGMQHDNNAVIIDLSEFF
jgi:hypothetical protein